MSKPKNIANQILKLREQGFTYQQIADTIPCSKSTVSYHCGQGQKDKYKLRTQKLRNKKPILKKLDNFIQRGNKQYTLHKFKSNNNIRQSLFNAIKTTKSNRKGIKMSEMQITEQQVIDKFGKQPQCYLTGEQLDWSDSKTYSFDHVIPASRGGSSDLDNLNVTTKQANFAKGDMTHDEFISFCKKVLIHHGYKISNP